MHFTPPATITAAWILDDGRTILVPSDTLTGAKRRTDPTGLTPAHENIDVESFLRFFGNLGLSSPGLGGLPVRALFLCPVIFIVCCMLGHPGPFLSALPSESEMIQVDNF